MTVQEALEQLRNVAGPKLVEVMPAEVSVSYSGTADRLKGAFRTMQDNLGIAAIVLLLILAAMFRSVWDAFLVMLSMPLAIAGGVLALRRLTNLSGARNRHHWRHVCQRCIHARSDTEHLEIAGSIGGESVRQPGSNCRCIISKH